MPFDPLPLVTADDPGNPELAQAVAAARRAAPGWGRLPGASRARVLREAAAALPGGPGTPGDGDGGDADRNLQGALLRWAARLERGGGAVQVGVVKGAGGRWDVPGGRALLARRPLGVLGVAWGWPRPLALQLLLPALALGNALVVVAPPVGASSAQRLRKALVAAGLPGGVLTVLSGNSRGSGSGLARHHPDGLWLCGGDALSPSVLLMSAHPGLRLGLCCERPSRLGGPGGTRGGSGAGPSPRRRAGAGAALHPPPLSLASGGRSLRVPPEPPKSAGISDLTLCPQPRDPHQNKLLRAAAAVTSLFSGGLGWSRAGAGGRMFWGCPAPHVPGRPGPPPTLGAAAPKALPGRAGGPERRSSRGIRGGVPGVRKGRPGVRGVGGGGSGRPAALTSSVPLSLSAAAPPRPEGFRRGSWGWLRERSRVPVCRPRLRTAMDLPPLRSALVPFLFLLAVPTPSSCCSFSFNPISSTFSAHLNNLVRPPLPGHPPAHPSTPPDLRDSHGTSRDPLIPKRFPCASLPRPPNSLIPQGRPRPGSRKPSDRTPSPPKCRWGPPECPPQPSGLLLGTP
ncbi:hypothetical protein DV515_00017234 [Chloebia gouldiae]|uniref:Aldehyde dehydrogenase domain-containing protein n=1 Tax=Chloebia gouldiae TaxID=44316 RepID=A0A3L8R0K2_CHLGU|nr:hypothetical protein DV515_00017234 [Chloebia gouldiae]